MEYVKILQRAAQSFQHHIKVAKAHSTNAGTPPLIHFYIQQSAHLRKTVPSTGQKKGNRAVKSFSLLYKSMESTLLCASSRFVSSQCYENAGAFGRNFRSSFGGKLLYPNLLLTRNYGTASRRRAIVSSVLGRKVKKEAIIPDPDYRIPIVLLGAAGGFVYVDNLAAAVPIGLLGLLLLVQATRVRFVFDDQALGVKIGDQLQESGENVFVGGKNRWKYSTFVNWELWWPTFPILVYFKETQTKPEGQIHFFPVIFNGKQLYDVMVERCGPSKTSGPK